MVCRAFMRFLLNVQVSSPGFNVQVGLRFRPARPVAPDSGFAALRRPAMTTKARYERGPGACLAFYLAFACVAFAPGAAVHSFSA
jgi:hypothetical protein